MTTHPTILAAMPATLPQLVAATGYKRNTVKTYLSDLKKSGRVHVGEWSRHESGQPLAVYAAGEGVDAIKRVSRRTAAVRESAVSYAMRSQPALARVWA